MSISLLALPLAATGLAASPANAPALPDIVLMAHQNAERVDPGTVSPSPAGQIDEAPQPDKTPDAAGPPSPEPAAQDELSREEMDAIIVSARKKIAADPVEQLNVQSFEVVQAVDEAVIAPITHGYMKVFPKPVQSGLRNVLNNLDEPIVFLNFLLQLKIGKAVETATRFAINSTVGVGGLIDVAKNKPINLPRRSNGLADTLGYYGVGPGPYLFLPIIGSTTVRDLVARPFDLAVLPFAFGKPFNKGSVALAKGSLSALDERADYDETLTRLRDASPDGYAATRDYYLAKRKAEIEVLRGKRKSINDPPFFDFETYKATAKEIYKAPPKKMRISPQAEPVASPAGRPDAMPSPAQEPVAAPEPVPSP